MKLIKACLMAAGGLSDAGAEDLIAACLTLGEGGADGGLAGFRETVDRSLSTAANLHTPVR